MVMWLRYQWSQLFTAWFRYGDAAAYSTNEGFRYGDAAAYSTNEGFRYGDVVAYSTSEVAV